MAATPDRTGPAPGLWFRQARAEAGRTPRRTVAGKVCEGCTPGSGERPGRSGIGAATELPITAPDFPCGLNDGPLIGARRERQGFPGEMSR